MSAKQKSTSWNNFKRIIDSRDISKLQKTLYEHLICHCGFIAHYNIHGFKDEYSGYDFKRFIEHFDRNNKYNQPPYVNLVWLYDKDYADINGLMVDYVTSRAPMIYQELENKRNNAELELMYKLAEKHGVKLESGLKKKSSSCLVQLSLFGQAS